ASTSSVSALISWNFKEELPQLITNTFIFSIPFSMFLKVRYLRTVYAGYLLLALYGCDRNHTYDIVSRASSGKIVNGSGNTLGNRSVRFRFAQSLNQFVTDISRIQIREDQHVGLSCYGRSEEHTSELQSRFDIVC